GVPSDLLEAENPSAWLLEAGDVRSRLKARGRVSHKGDSGRVVLVAGSPGMVGAARLVSRACLRTGAGLVTILSDADTVSQLQEGTVEVMTRPFSDSGGHERLLEESDAIVVGPGMG